MKTENKVALVLGSINGIGKGIGLALARENINVALNYFDREEMLDELQQNFSKLAASHLIIRANLLKTEKIRELVGKVISHFGRLDILINNIERGGWPVVHGPYTGDQWDLEIATTLRAKQWIFESSLPYLKASGNGIVINISSMAGIVGRSGPASFIFNEGYSAANRGISILTETWARLGAPEVRVNEIMLGIIETRHGEKTRGWGLLTETQKQAIIDHTLVGRTGTLDDVIKAALFLIKDAPFMTGSVLRLDGGYILGGEKVAPMPKGVL
ncbi:MAG: SDR family oxidoreductase [Desulfobacterales bacterium]|nr:SDR family oxidoreductase [Desulfobacterales bacterium]